MRHTVRRRAVLTGVAFGLATPVVRVRAAPPRAGEVTMVHGDCFARSGVVQRALVPNADIFVGDSVGTGPASSLALLLGEATTVRLGPEAQLRIDRFLVNAGGVLTLDKGAVLYDHDAKDGPDNMVVRSPFGLIAVRGTRFFAGPSNGVFGVFVERGEVFVVGVSTAVTVTAGMGTNIATPGAEPTLPTAWGKPRIAAAMGQFGQ
ncbi:MAG TPA: FecR family protein [Acetobacteraceae bacterium]|jgi:ferric-dicitrate binding protein FerR (iron transport regulator)|nr:FecR family protein [Acetobacteraceae bacterium]